MANIGKLVRRITVVPLEEEVPRRKGEPKERALPQKEREPAEREVEVAE